MDKLLQRVFILRIHDLMDKIPLLVHGNGLFLAEIAQYENQLKPLGRLSLDSEI